MNVEQLGSVVAITVICYLIGMGVKASGVDNKWIPIIVGVCGGVLGALGMGVIPDYPAHDMINAIAVGILSGLASTGADQIVKQQRK